MRRYLCVYLPMWPFELISAKKRKLGSSTGNPPVVLSTALNNQPVVAHCCLRARQAGIKPGISLTLARAMLPEAQVHEYAPAYDCRALLKLSRWMLRFAPLIALDEEVRVFLDHPTGPPPLPLHYSVSLDITGTERCHNGEEALVRRVIEGLTAKGFFARTAIADTIAGAWALAHFSASRSSIVQGFTEQIGELSLRALRLTEETCRMLHELGMRTLYDVLALPRSSLGVRFGPELPARIEALCGSKSEPFHALTFASPHCITERFDVPLTSHAQLLHVCMQILEHLVKKLLVAKEYAGLFIISMESLNMENTVELIRKEVSLYAARSSLEHIRSILLPVIESIHSAQGIRAVSIKAARTERASPEQADFLHGAQRRLKEEGDDLLNLLLTQLGAKQVSTVRFSPSYVPERSFAYIPLGSKKQREEEGGEVHEGRPPYLFESPEPLSVLSMLPDSPPSRLTWDGVELRILKGIGPEKICAEWWRDESLPAVERERDYFRVQDETGRWLWLFRARSSMQWFVQGMWV